MSFSISHLRGKPGTVGLVDGVRLERNTRDGPVNSDHDGKKRRKRITGKGLVGRGGRAELSRAYRAEEAGPVERGHRSHRRVVAEREWDGWFQEARHSVGEFERGSTFEPPRQPRRYKREPKEL